MSALRLVLASASPRRRSLLEILGIPFEVMPAAIDEVPKAGEEPAAFAARAAREKGEEVARRTSGALVLAADTIVSLDGGIFGKPRSLQDAVHMLETLSDRRHSVFTAVAVVDATTGATSEGVEETRVWFRRLDRALIDAYLQREDVLDKAGAYAIQGFASVFIPRIEGNYQNVIGLPLSLTYELLRRHASARAALP